MQLKKEAVIKLSTIYVLVYNESEVNNTKSYFENHKVDIHKDTIRNVQIERHGK